MSSTRSLRLSWSRLSRKGRWLTLPPTVIHLHEVRGFFLDLAGALVSFIAVVALAPATGERARQGELEGVRA